VLVVGSDELTVGDDKDTSSEAAEGWGMRRRTLGYHVVGPGLVMWSRLARPGLPRRPRYIAEAASTKNFHICTCFCHICVLLINTNPMIYNMLYKIWY
jgi:hypothetical protein